MRVLKQSTARTIAVFLADSSDHITGKTGATLTVTASKNGASFASISPTVTELANGWYSVALTTSHTDTLGDLAIHATASGADPIDTLSQVVAYNPADSVRLGLTALPNAAAEASGGLITRGSGTGQMLVLSGLCSASVAVDGVGAASIASGAYAAIADAVIDYALTNGAAGGLGAMLLSLDARIPTSLVAGRMDASVGAMASNVMTAAALASDAATEIATAVLNTQMTESYAADGAAPTLTQSVLMTQQHLCDASISSTTKTVKKLDGSTAAATFTLDSATSPTSITRAS